LDDLFTKKLITNKRALDCGAGLGRVTKYLLSKNFEKIDLVEQNTLFIKESIRYLDGVEEVGERFESSLRDFRPQKGLYSCIWVQWVSTHLLDLEFVDFLGRCKEGLVEEGGLIVLKENVSEGKTYIDQTDFTVVRSLQGIGKLIKKANLNIHACATQVEMPEDLCTVIMLAMK
jgi:protein N-terminal methyltransferase